MGWVFVSFLAMLYILFLIATIVGSRRVISLIMKIPALHISLMICAVLILACITPCLEELTWLGMTVPYCPSWVNTSSPMF